MATKTINLTGAEVAVTGLDGAHAHIRNDSTDTIYAAKMPGITAGADGVASIPAGQADTLRGISGAVYLLGTGSALIQSDDYVESPFKASTASGGSAVDEVARTAASAHAGNADIHVTADEKAAWNAVNYSNPNLMVNPDFKINQLGLTEYTAKGQYTVDRWRMTNNDGGIIDVTSSGVDFSTTGGIVGFIQTCEAFGNEFLGKTFTLSALINETTVTVSGVFEENITKTVASIDFDGGTLTLASIAESGILYPRAQITCGGSKTLSISWVKLELGSIATPFTPPDPATELAKCQRYYQIRSTGDIAEVDLRPSMRATPTITQLSDGNYAYSAEL